MQESLRQILEIQELDMKMIRLMRLRKERRREQEQISTLRGELHTQLTDKQKEIEELSQITSRNEKSLEETVAKLKKLEGQQASVKKVDEFNAITHELTAAEKERVTLEQKISDLVDKRVAEEEILEKIRDSLKSSDASSAALEHEIEQSMQLIQTEENSLKQERAALAAAANPELLKIYERLLSNKRDRVVVAIENRTCTGCHIVVTAQHENLVRKGGNLVFCEHCSRIHYWREREEAEGGAATTKRRRRKVATA